MLNLAETKLNSIPDGVLHALSATLKWLILSGNQFNKVPEELQNAINLEYLNLNNNPITGLNSKSFQGLVSLKRLNNSPFVVKIKEMVHKKSDNEVSIVFEYCDRNLYEEMKFR